MVATLRSVPVVARSAPVAALQVERTKAAKRLDNAKLLAARRHQVIEKLLAAFPRATRERVLGAGYSDLPTMTDVELGEYLGRVQAIVGVGGE